MLPHTQHQHGPDMPSSPATLHRGAGRWTAAIKFVPTVVHKYSGISPALMSEWIAFTSESGDKPNKVDLIVFKARKFSPWVDSCVPISFLDGAIRLV
ncbi:hypothetical protein NL676_008973 [Syzygium grande]|nr:hypothetical protein NL676_008973 [Syzygium grande]